MRKMEKMSDIFEQQKILHIAYILCFFHSSPRQICNNIYIHTEHNRSTDPDPLVHDAGTRHSTSKTYFQMKNNEFCKDRIRTSNDYRVTIQLSHHPLLLSFLCFSYLFLCCMYAHFFSLEGKEKKRFFILMIFFFFLSKK